MRPGLEAVVIADDLTGAADTGVQLTAIGSPVYLMPVATMAAGHPWMDAACGISVYTASRQLSSDGAAERLRMVADALPGLCPRWVYKKIDSCLRGNIGTEIDVLLDALGLDAALVAPALPAQGRTTIGGIHRVYGRPLADTELARDPLAPVRSSAVADILASQSRYPAGRIDVKEYGDPGGLQRALQGERERGCRLIVCDAVVQSHLDQLATLVVQNAGHLLPVGSAGLATALVRQLPARLVGRPCAGATVEAPPEPGLERLLLVCGTGSRVTRGQIDALLQRYPGIRYELEPEWLIAASARGRRRRAAELRDAWTRGILALAIRPFPLEGPEVNPAQAGTGLAALAGLALEVIRAGGVKGLGLFLSGGETADAFRQVSGGEAIALERELLPGLVLGRWLGGVADGLPVVTKAGAFGGQQTLVALYERLSGGAGP